MTTDIKELKRLASSAELGCLSHGNKRSFAELDAFHVAAHPSAVLNLIAHIEQLEGQLSAQTAEPVAEDPMQKASKLISALLLEAEKFWWNDGPGGKSAINLCNAEAALYAHLRLCFAHPAKTEQPAAPQQAVAWTVTVGEDVKNCIEITHCEEDARAQYAESTKGGYENLYLLRPLYFHPLQRQDSDKEHN